MTWRKSTRCAGNGAFIEIRRTADPNGPKLTLSPGGFRGLLNAIKETR
jgi:hypothetical protein